jgi:hypothetical protein
LVGETILKGCCCCCIFTYGSVPLLFAFKLDGVIGEVEVDAIEVEEDDCDCENLVEEELFLSNCSYKNKR